MKTIAITLSGLISACAFSQIPLSPVTLLPVDITKTTVNTTGQTAYGIQMLFDGHPQIVGHFNGGFDYIGEGSFNLFTLSSGLDTTILNWSQFDRGNGLHDIPNGQFVWVGASVPASSNLTIPAVSWLDMLQRPYAEAPQVDVQLTPVNSSVQGTVTADFPSLPVPVPFGVGDFQFGLSKKRLSLQELYEGHDTVAGNPALAGILNPVPGSPKFSLDSGQSGKFLFDQPLAQGDFLILSFDVSGLGTTTRDVMQFQAVPEPGAWICMLGVGCALLRRRSRSHSGN